MLQQAGDSVGGSGVNQRVAEFFVHDAAGQARENTHMLSPAACLLSVSIMMNCASSSPQRTGAFRRATLMVDCSICSDLLCGMAKLKPSPVENTALARP
ncbi:Uncharacterised protein [Salmonella enterica subsp. enterica]|uniref:Uncharacterized protein n=1 Tax=Salmonella enterica I TaxID=59201 RepID=A0A379X429_SALET|nr:Uncharacterised protein [Salmonella enterica subsp. enterica]